MLARSVPIGRAEMSTDNRDKFNYKRPVAAGSGAQAQGKGSEANLFVCKSVHLY